MVKKQKSNLLHKTERDILSLFNKIVVPLSVNAVAEKLDISYSTAKKYLYSLFEKNLIEKVEDETKNPKKTKKTRPKRKN